MVDGFVPVIAVGVRSELYAEMPSFGCPQSLDIV